MTPQGSNHQDLGYEILQHKYGRFYFPKWLGKISPIPHIFLQCKIAISSSNSGVLLYPLEWRLAL